jgi:hypothetical protein
MHMHMEAFDITGGQRLMINSTIVEMKRHSLYDLVDIVVEDHDIIICLHEQMAFSHSPISHKMQNLLLHFRSNHKLKRSTGTVFDLPRYYLIKSLAK